MADWTSDELAELKTVVNREISQAWPSVVERRITTNGGTSRPDNLDIDLSTFIDNVSRIYGVRRAEYLYGQTVRQYRAIDWKTDTIISLRINLCPTTGTAITALADNGDGTINVSCASHGLKTNDVATLLNLTGYVGTFMDGPRVVTYVDDDTFKVTATFIKTATGNIGELVGLTLEEEHTLGDTASSNTYSPWHEEAFTKGMVAHAWDHWLEETRSEINNAISAISTANAAIDDADTRVTAAVAKIASGATETGKVSALISSAATEIAKITTEVGLAKTGLAAGRALINSNTTTAHPALDYASIANGEVNTGIGYLRSGQGYLEQAKADESLSNNYLGLAGKDLQAAQIHLSRGSSYMAEVNTRLNTSLKLMQITQREAERKMHTYKKALQGLATEYNKRMAYTNRMYARS